jgi:hypothetical protein
MRATNCCLFVKGPLIYSRRNFAPQALHSLAHEFRSDEFKLEYSHRRRGRTETAGDRLTHSDTPEPPDKMKCMYA